MAAIGAAPAQRAHSPPTGHAQRDQSGTMGLNEFRELYQALDAWKGSMVRYDQDRSGTIEGRELHNAIRDFGERRGARLAPGVFFFFFFFVGVLFFVR